MKMVEGKMREKKTWESLLHPTLTHRLTSLDRWITQDILKTLIHYKTGSMW
jgi:hypothetical protein